MRECANGGPLGDLVGSFFAPPTAPPSMSNTSATQNRTEVSPEGERRGCASLALLAGAVLLPLFCCCLVVLPCVRRHRGRASAKPRGSVKLRSEAPDLIELTHTRFVAEMADYAAERGSVLDDPPPPPPSSIGHLPTLPPGWEMVADDDESQPYFYNAETGESVWEVPTAAAATAAEPGEETLEMPRRVMHTHSVY